MTSLGIAHDYGFHRYSKLDQYIFLCTTAVSRLILSIYYFLNEKTLNCLCLLCLLGSDGLKVEITTPKRSEPSSRNFLIGEQPNPWDLLQPQDKLSRHRGAEHRRRYGRSGDTSLLSPG